MNIIEEAMKHPDAIATHDFIETAIREVEDEILYIENKHNVTLVADRADLDRARIDWMTMTYAQVVHSVSLWKAGIFGRYNK